jgi:hypothetical protein
LPSRAGCSAALGGVDQRLAPPLIEGEVVDAEFGFVVFCHVASEHSVRSDAEARRCCASAYVALDDQGKTIARPVHFFGVKAK